MLRLQSQEQENSLTLEAPRVPVRSVIGQLGEGETPDLVVLSLEARELRHLVDYLGLWAANETPEQRHDLAMAAWEEQFCAQLSQDELCKLLERAHYLNARPLVDVLCVYIARQLRHLSPQQLVGYLGADVVYGTPGTDLMDH